MAGLGHVGVLGELADQITDVGERILNKQSETIL